MFSTSIFANTPRSTGKYKNWESFIVETDKGKICFAQTVPTKRAPSSIQRGKSKLFVTFRPSENIQNAKVTDVLSSNSHRLFSIFSICVPRFCSVFVLTNCHQLFIAYIFQKYSRENLKSFLY